MTDHCGWTECLEYDHVDSDQKYRKGAHLDVIYCASKCEETLQRFSTCNRKTMRRI